MTQVKLRLVGTSEHNPAGESLLTVIERVAGANRMSGMDLVAELTQRGRRAFDAASSIDPDNRAVVNVEKLIELSGWAHTALDMSFYDGYRPSSADRLVDNKTFFDVAPFMRLCPSCSQSGVHLLLHQCRPILRCPIHQEPLVAQCPDCGSPLARYAYPPRLPTSMACSNDQCGWRAWRSLPAVDQDLQNKRSALVADYQKWRREIDRAACGQVEGTFLLSAPRRFASLVNQSALLPGPDWLAKCVRGGGHLRLHSQKVEAPFHIIEDLFATSDDPNDPPRPCRSLERATRNANNQVIQLSKRLSKVDRHLSQAYRQERWQTGAHLTEYGYRLVVTEHTSIFEVALLWWKTCQHLPIDGITRKERQLLSAAGDLTAGFQRPWMDGMSRLSAGPYGENRSRVDALARKVCHQWYERMCIDLFFSLLGRASLLHLPPVRPDQLVEAAYDTGAMPSVSLVREDDGVRLCVASTRAEDHVFRKMASSGYTGIEKRLPTKATYGEQIRQQLGLAVYPAEPGDEDGRSASVYLLTATSSPIPASPPPQHPEYGFEQASALEETGPDVDSHSPDDKTSLKVLLENPLVEVEAKSLDCWRIKCRGRAWHLWPHVYSWIEIENVDGEDRSVGERHYGTIAAFNLKCILRVPHLPTNYAKSWNPDEKGLLQQFANQPVTVNELAIMLGRTPRSIVAKLGSLLGIDMGQVQNEKRVGDLQVQALIASGTPLPRDHFVRRR